MTAMLNAMRILTDPARPARSPSAFLRMCREKPMITPKNSLENASGIWIASPRVPRRWSGQQNF